MGLFDSIKRAFDAGGIKIDLESVREFRWGDPQIPTRVTLTGHKSEPKLIRELSFTLKDEPEGSSAPGMRDRDNRDIAGRKFNSTWIYPLGLQLAPGETRVIDVGVPLAAQGGPGLLSNLQIRGGGLSLSFGDEWYRLSVAAPVEGANMAKGTSVKMKARG